MSTQIVETQICEYVFDARLNNFAFSLTVSGVLFTVLHFKDRQLDTITILMYTQARVIAYFAIWFKTEVDDQRSFIQKIIKCIKIKFAKKTFELMTNYNT